MAFTVPSFPLSVQIWSNGVNPVLNPPRLITVGNLAYGKRVTTQYWDWAASGAPGVFSLLLLPALVDVRDVFSPGGVDTIEVVAGSGRFYLVDLVDDAGKGFSNEHRFAVMHKTDTWGTWPIPIP